MTQIDPKEFESIYSLEQLFEKLDEKVFMKTKIDVVYSDYMNWERGGLLINKLNKNKSSAKKLSYSEYIWTKVVDELRRYNFSYSQIIDFKKLFFGDLSVFATQFFKENKEIAREKLLDFLTEEQVDMALKEDIRVDPKYSCLFYTALKTVIVEKEELFIVITREDARFFELVSKTILNDNDRFNQKTNFDYLLSTTHLNISFSNIVTPFLKPGTDCLAKVKSEILTDEEHKILKIVRNKPQELKSINIKFADQKPVSLEIKSMKKVQVESRLLEFIKKGEYLNIEIASSDGKILKFENTKKIKL